MVVAIYNKVRPRGCYIIFTAALLIILLIPAKNYIWDSTYDFGITQRPANPHDITIVTMYINIGKFQKGEGGNYFTPVTYKNFMTTWGWLTNRVIAFFDNDDDLESFRAIRSLQPEDRTVLIKLNRNEIPAFRHLEKIRTIYQNNSYPKHPPNTVFAEYSCAMSAKHDVLKMATQRGLVHTDHMAWLDIGLFRNLVEPKSRPRDDRFTLEVPENFNSSTIGMAEVTPRNDVSKLSPWAYIKENQVWVAGGFLLATQETMLKFYESYTSMMEELLSKNLSSTDQQVIGAMYSPDYIKRQKVDIVGYRCHDGQFGLHGSDAAYFCLGYICKDAAEKRLNASRAGRVDQIH